MWRPLALITLSKAWGVTDLEAREQGRDTPWALVIFAWRHCLVPQEHTLLVEGRKFTVTSYNGTLHPRKTHLFSDRRREERGERRAERGERREESGERREQRGERREQRGERRAERGERREERDGDAVSDTLTRRQALALPGSIWPPQNEETGG